MADSSRYPAVVYTYASALRDPFALWQAVARDLARCGPLAWRLFLRDLRGQFRESYLGYFWAFAPPIFWAASLTLANETKVINIGKTDLPFPAYVLISVSLWQLFHDCARLPADALTEARDLYMRIRVPLEGLVLSRLGTAMFGFAIKIVLIALAFWAFSIPVRWSLAFAFPALVVLSLFGVAIGGLCAPVLVLFHDARRAFDMMLGALMFLTPVIYPVPNVGLFSDIVAWNPVTPLLVTVRELATGGALTQLTGFAVVGALAGVIVLNAWIWMRLTLPYLAERAGA